MLSYDRYLVMRDGMYLCYSYRDGFNYQPDVGYAELFLTLDIVNEYAKVFGGTVHHVTIVVAL